MRVTVIILKRTPERWVKFLKCNVKAHLKIGMFVIDGIDGEFTKINSKITSS